MEKKCEKSYQSKWCTVSWKNLLQTDVTAVLFVSEAGASWSLSAYFENNLNSCWWNVVFRMWLCTRLSTDYRIWLPQGLWISTLWAGHGSPLIYDAVAPTEWPPQVTTNLSVMCWDADQFMAGVIKELSTQGHQSWLKHESKGSH